MPTDYLTTDEVAAAVGISARAVQKQCAKPDNPLGAIKHGRDWLVPASMATKEAWREAVGRPGPQRSA